MKRKTPKMENIAKDGSSRVSLATKPEATLQWDHLNNDKVRQWWEKMRSWWKRIKDLWD